MSRDLSTVIFISIVALVYNIIVNPLRTIVVGLPFFKYVFSIGSMILISLSLLLYDGRRWRFFFQGSLIAFLTIPLNSGAMKFIIVTGIMIPLINSLHGDLFFNMYHSYFKKRGKLKHWSVLINVQFYLAAMFLNVINFYLFFNERIAQIYLNSLIIVIPIIVTECFVSGRIGYSIYLRIKKTDL